MKNKLLTTFKIASYCQVTHRAVQQWIAQGKLKSFRTPGGHNRVSFDDFMLFLKTYQMPFPEELKSFAYKRVLVVDDDPTILVMMRSVLGNSGYQVQTAQDGFEAGKKFAEFKPDLVTLDIRMPKMDGYAVLKMIRGDSDLNKLKVLIVSGINDPVQQKRILEAGADRFMRKPIDRKGLLTAVSELLAERMV